VFERGKTRPAVRLGGIIALFSGFHLGARVYYGPVQRTVFERIIAREIPSEIIYEDDRVAAFRDVHPQAPTHILIVPKKPVARMAEAGPEDESLLGHLLLKAAQVAAQAGLSNGYRLVINNGQDGGESVPHLHCHILGGRPMSWPPG